MFCKIGAFKNFAKFTENISAGVFFNKVASLHLYQKETPAQVSSFKFCGIFKNTYFVEHMQTVASGC